MQHVRGGTKVLQLADGSKCVERIERQTDIW
jgi:hypothetical protein